MVEIVEMLSSKFTQLHSEMFRVNLISCDNFIQAFKLLVRSFFHRIENEVVMTHISRERERKSRTQKNKNQIRQIERNKETIFFVFVQCFFYFRFLVICQCRFCPGPLLLTIMRRIL